MIWVENLPIWKVSKEILIYRRLDHWGVCLQMIRSLANGVQKRKFRSAGNHEVTVGQCWNNHFLLLGISYHFPTIIKVIIFDLPKISYILYAYKCGQVLISLMTISEKLPA